MNPLKQPWDFGSVKKGSIVEKTFHVENSGDENLVIERVRSCCGYVVVDVSDWTIEPGEKSEIRISSDSRLKSSGRDTKNITMLSNDPDRPELEIPVTINIH